MSGFALAMSSLMSLAAERDQMLRVASCLADCSADDGRYDVTAALSVKDWWPLLHQKSCRTLIARTTEVIDASCQRALHRRILGAVHRHRHDRRHQPGDRRSRRCAPT